MATDHFEEDIELDDEIVEDDDLDINVLDDEVDFEEDADFVAPSDEEEEDDDVEDEEEEEEAAADEEAEKPAEVADDLVDDDDDVVVDEDDDEEEEDEETLEVLLGPDSDTAVSPSRSRTDDSGDAPPGEGEFTCRSCFLVKRRAQLADAEEMICLDCA